MAPKSKAQFEEIREKRRAEILDAAFHIFSENGYHNASVSQIAKRAKVSKGLMYNYFDSKEEVLRAIMHQLLEDIYAYFDIKTITHFTDESMANYINKSLDIVLQDIKRWRLYVSLSMQPDVTPIFLDMAKKDMSQLLHALLQYFSEKGVSDPVFYMRYYMAVTDGIQLQIMLDPESFPIEKAKQLLIQQITNPET